MNWFVKTFSTDLRLKKNTLDPLRKQLGCSSYLRFKIFAVWVGTIFGFSGSRRSAYANPCDYSEQHNCLRTTTWTVTECGIERMYSKQLSSDKETVKKANNPQFPGSTFASANSSAVAVCRPASTHNTSSLQNTQLHQKDSRKSHASGQLPGKSGSVCVPYRMGKKKMTNSTKMCPYRPARPDVAQYIRHRTTLSALGIHALAQDICSCGCQ
jgi:hypothetical protein